MCRNSRNPDTVFYFPDFGQFKNGLDQGTLCQVCKIMKEASTSAEQDRNFEN